MSLSIVEFLNARLDEDWEAATAADHSAWEVREWTNNQGVEFIVVNLFDNGRPAFAFSSLENATHVLRHQPQQVFRDIKAKRRLIREHYVIQHVRGGEAHQICSRCSDFIDRGETFRIEVAPCNTLRLLALPFSNHPDYDPAWAVTD